MKNPSPLLSVCALFLVAAIAGENDDILLHENSVDARPIADAHDATLSVAVSDMDGVPLSCRITIVDEGGALAPIIDRR